MMDAAEVAKHNTVKSCWVIIADNVYDVTELLDSHPGGSHSILRHAGQDATEAYEPVHPSGTLLRHLPQEKHLGRVDPATLRKTSAESGPDKSTAVKVRRTSITVCQNLDDIEAFARQLLSRKAWAYFNSAADSLHSLNTNRLDWTKIFFRPRILRNVTRARMHCRIMGHDSSLPIFIAPAAMAKLGHPDGELCLGYGAAKSNIVYCISTYSSVAHNEVAACFTSSSSGALVFQLYVPKRKEDATKLIEMAQKLHCTALVITVDTAVVGRREEDDRYQAELEVEEGREVPRIFSLNDDESAPVYRGHHCSTLDWEDVRRLKDLWGTSGPVYIKGIQSAEDAVLASQLGVDGIYLSNHGGRQLDFAPSSIRTLLELRKFYPEILDSPLEIYLDGGVRRGTDVVKALCLGATGVGLGRPFLYALGAYGTDGVLRAIQLLSAEIQTTMRLMGVTDIKQLNPGYVNCTQLERELPDVLQEPHKRQYKL